MANRELIPIRAPIPVTEESWAMANWWPAPEPDHMVLLAQFEPIGLDQMAGVALLDRTETKFVFNEQRLDSLLEKLLGSYQVLEVNTSRLNHYRTLYFDTPDFALFRRHHAGGRNRFKVRSRTYLDSDLSFLEVKHKVKKNWTVKHRIKTADFIDRLSPQTDGFLNDYLPDYSGQLAPKLWNEYTRITLVGMNNPERVTVDLNLQFRGGGQTMILPGIAIAEVKKNGPDRDSTFTRLMQVVSIRSTGFSKYCVGVSMLYPEVKHNRFKRNLRMVSKLIQEKEQYV